VTLSRFPLARDFEKHCCRSGNRDSGAGAGVIAPRSSTARTPRSCYGLIVSLFLRISVVCALSAVLACSKDVTTDFPAGLSPLEDVGTAPPPATATDPHPEAIVLEQGRDDAGDWVHAAAYVHANAKDVWTALANPDVVADRHNVTAYTSTLNVEPYDVSFQLHYRIDNVITVQFDLTFREGLVSGTKDAPTAVSVVYEKTFGSSLITMMKGSIEVTSVDENTSELIFAQRMIATQTSADNIAAWTRSIYGSVVAQVHGQPLP